MQLSSNAYRVLPQKTKQNSSNGRQHKHIRRLIFSVFSMMKSRKLLKSLKES